MRQDPNASAFEELAVWTFKGEVFGESLFRGLQDGFPEHATELSALGDLEREMARVFAPVLQRHGIDIGDCRGSAAAGRKSAEAIAATSWSEFIALFDAATDDALRKYERLRHLAANADARAVDLLIAHEKSLQSFAAACDGHAGGDALQEVRRVLAELEAALVE